MTTLVGYQALNMLNPVIWYGSVTESSSSRITITNNAGTTAVYHGSFTYSGNNITGGVITGYDLYNNYSIATVISGGSYDAQTVKHYLDAGDARGLYQFALSGNDQINGSAFADTLVGWAGNDSISGNDGNDQIYGGYGNDSLDGGLGIDTARYSGTMSNILAATSNSDGSITLRTNYGSDTLANIEYAGFTDGTLSIGQLLAQYQPPTYQTDTGNVTASIYTGAVDFIDFQMLGRSTGDVVTGSARNDFINLLGGDDAANGGDGKDVLDGGVGSNFLTGGRGIDTFFLDGRSGSNTWSTITDFEAEDAVNIWGWQNGVSQLILSLEGQGATGFEGATFHYDLNGDRLIDTSITFSHLTLASISAPTAEEIAGNGYLLFA